MSEKYIMFKEYYDEKLWDKKRLKVMVVKGHITVEEFKMITGEEFEE